MNRKAEIEQALSVLVGLPWRGIGQAAGMGVLDFADEVEVESGVHGKVPRSRYSLHLQCPFRVAVDDLFLLGSDDLAVRGSKDGHETRYDFLAAQLDERLTVSPLVVREVDGSQFGDVNVRFDHGIVVHVFVACGIGESWRLVVRPEGEGYVFESPAFREMT